MTTVVAGDRVDMVAPNGVVEDTAKVSEVMRESIRVESILAPGLGYTLFYREEWEGWKLPTSLGGGTPKFSSSSPVYQIQRVE